ncbi:MAG: 5-formyltetrahydrofolate cyclo-ligase [archaeon]
MKEALREKVSESNRGASDLVMKSLKIAEAVMCLPEYEEADMILFYVSQGDEVRTHGLIKDSLYIGKGVAVPVSNTQTGEIEVYEIKDFSELVPGAYGILEPAPKFRRHIDSAEIDLVVVPGVAFDENGNRLGRGKGYYDKFLAKLPKTVPRIALAYEHQIVGEVPAEGHDAKVDKIITETRVI